jgi:hypothetical protein
MENSIFKLNIDENAKYYLQETAKWARFLAIVGISLTVILCLLGLVMIAFTITSFYDQRQYAAIGFAYIILGMIQLYPILRLLSFGKRMKEGLMSDNQQTFENSLLNLKNCFKFIGIATIITLILYGIIILVAVIFGLSNL